MSGEWLVETEDAAKVAEFFRGAVKDAFEQENTRLQSDRDPTRLSMSGLGGCTRACAYAVARIPASDVHPPEEARQALLGTGAHLWFLPALARTLQLAGLAAEIEHQVELRAGVTTIRGSLDLATTGVVLDLKTVREHKLAGIRRRGGAFQVHRLQVWGYAFAQLQRHLRGEIEHPPRWVIFIYMDRTSGEVEVVCERFTNAAAEAVLRRISDVQRWADVDPDSAPREAPGPTSWHPNRMTGPGMESACDRCPWLRRCWGPDAVPGQVGAQATAAGDWEGLRQALALLADAAARSTEADRDKDFARMVLARTKAGTYGDWRFIRNRPSEVDDTAAAAAWALEHGYVMTKKKRAGAVKAVRVEQKEQPA